MPDVLVIGGGLAGACAALAARAAGRQVILVRRGPGATALSSGTVDFAAGEDRHAQRPPESIAEAAVELARARPRHPYALLGDALAAAVDEAIRFLRAELGLAGAKNAGARNMLIATPFGTVKQAALAQPGIAAGDLRTLGDEVVGVVELPGCGAFPPGLACAGLDAELRRRGTKARAAPIAVDAFRRRADAFIESYEVAAALDTSAFREQIGEGLARRARDAGVKRLLFPVAGIQDAAGALADLERRTGLSTAEMPGAPPSVPGLRLQRTIEARLRAAGVELRDGEAVGPGAAHDRRLGSLRVKAANGEEQIAAVSFVLATGRFIGGGVVHHREGRAAGFGEPVFDLPVHADGRPGNVSIKNLLGVWPENDHAAMRAGVQADGRLRPLDAEGRPLFENLFACGAVLGGHDPALDKSGLGVEAVTGLLAGRAAGGIG